MITTKQWLLEWAATVLMDSDSLPGVAESERKYLIWIYYNLVLIYYKFTPSLILVQYHLIHQLIHIYYYIQYFI